MINARCKREMRFRKYFFMSFWLMFTSFVLCVLTYSLEDVNKSVAFFTFLCSINSCFASLALYHKFYTNYNQK